MTLLEVVRDLQAVAMDATIYLVKPWTADSAAIVEAEPGGGLPTGAMRGGAAYFLEVSVAQEFLEDWTRAQGRMVPLKERCERLIQYAIADA